jgi:hypothetical protein
MKKLLFLLSIILLSSCTCIIGQIPPQYLYVDETCGAAMPDFLTKIQVTDNCEIDTVWQSPTYGTWLTAPANNAMIRAIDKFGNHTDVLFTVFLLDTVPPVITVDTTMLVNSYGFIDTLYDTAERMLARQVWFEESTAPDSLWTDDDFCNSTLLTWTDPCLAFTGEGHRVHTFISRADTVIIQRK